MANIALSAQFHGFSWKVRPLKIFFGLWKMAIPYATNPYPPCKCRPNFILGIRISMQTLAAQSISSTLRFKNLPASYRPPQSIILNVTKNRPNKCQHPFLGHFHLFLAYSGYAIMWGAAKGSSFSWVAKFKGEENSECKLSNGWSRSCSEIKLLLSAGK